MDILKLMNYLAVVTNLGMILFTSKEIESWYPGISATSKIWAIIIAEVVFEETSFLHEALVVHIQVVVGENHSRCSNMGKATIR